MNVLVSVDNGYVEPLMVMLKSLFSTNSWCGITVYLLYSDITDKNIDRLKRFVHDCKHRIICIEVDRGLFNNIPTRTFSEETYYRLLACKYLPQSVDKILFLDPDMIVKQSLQEIYSQDLGRYYFFAVKDTENEVIKKFRVMFRVPAKYPYVNSGFLLINLKKMRNKVDICDIIEYIKRNANRLTYLDQDVLNAYFYKEIKIISDIYNYDTRFYSIRDIISYPFQIFRDRMKKEICVLHYKGPNKPWKKGYGGKFGSCFYSHAEAFKGKEISRNNRYNRRTWIYYLKQQYLSKLL